MNGHWILAFDTIRTHLNDTMTLSVTIPLWRTGQDS